VPFIWTLWTIWTNTIETSLFRHYFFFSTSIFDPLNTLQLFPEQEEELKASASHGKKKTIWDLYASPVLRWRALAINLHWSVLSVLYCNQFSFRIAKLRERGLPSNSPYIRFVDTLIYYAMSLNVRSLSGNLYINVMLVRLVDLPAVILGALAINWRCLGRRYTMSSSMALAGCMSLALIFLKLENGEK